MINGAGARPLVGVLPAAGNGSRLAPLRYPKELLPVVYEPLADGSDGLRPKIVAEFALEALVGAGAERCLAVVAPWKLAFAFHFGDGERFGIKMGYLLQEEPTGLAHALDLAHGWTQGSDVAFAMPDTVLQPTDFLARVRSVYQDRRADLALAVFPTDEAERLGPVAMGPDGTVLAVQDKCPTPFARNTWAAAIWGDRFADFLHLRLAGQIDDRPLGAHFDAAVREGFRVVAVDVTDGRFGDIGTPRGALECLRLAALAGEGART